jgi:AAA15 family ATPase/GTPase
MFSPIKGLKIRDNCYCFKGEPNDTLDLLSKINIFVGENNSGKSRLLRSLLASDLKYVPAGYDLEILNHFIKNLKQDIDNYFKNNGLLYTNLPPFLRNLPIQEVHQIKTIDYIDSFIELADLLDKFRNEIIERQGNADSFVGTSMGNKYSSKISADLRYIFDENLSSLSIHKEGNSFKETLEIPSFSKIYIPILRGIRPINLNNLSNSEDFTSEDVYELRTKYDYFKDAKCSVQIFTGLTTYSLIKKYLLGKFRERDLIKDYERYLSKNFFNNKPITLLPENGSDVLTIKIGNEIEKPVYDVGDGIQSLIILTLPLFLHKSEHVLFFIEEPEKLLHPGLQRKLIETFLNSEDGFENYQFFMTTHSNHFLDITLDFSDVSIYSLRKEFEDISVKAKEIVPKFFIENLSHGDISSLELLGVRNSSVFLSNCTIWVEGITDRLYFKHYLNLYKNYLYDENIQNPEKNEFIDFKEDLRFCQN